MVLVSHRDKKPEADTRTLLAIVLVLLVVVIAMGVALTVRFLREPPRAAPTAAIQDSVSEPVVLQPRTETPAWPLPVRQDGSGPALNLPPDEMARYLRDQETSLREELAENAGNSNGLTPSAEEIERIAREGRVIF